MREVVIGVTGGADRLLADGLEELRPVFEALAGGCLVVGGLMTRVWLHLCPIGVPPRATADVDIGIDRKRLGLVGDRRLIAPLLEQAGFDPRPGEEQFRFQKEVDSGLFPVDLGIAPGDSRDDPPLLEPGITTIAIPGLAYALTRPAAIRVKFVDGSRVRAYDLPLPELDAAFVLKGALVESGVRLRPDRRQRDTVDAISLAAACLDGPGALEELHSAQRRRGDVRKAIGWVADSFRSMRTASSRRVQEHFEEEAGLSIGAEWAVETAARFSARLAALD